MYSRYTVDGQPYETAICVATGAFVKAKAGLDPSYILLRDDDRGDARRVLDSDRLTLDGLSFYSAPPATGG